MPKEITLEDLAKTAKPTTEKPTTTPVTEEVVQEVETVPATAKQPQQKQHTKAPESPKHGAVKMSANQVADSLIKSGKMKPKSEEVVDAPLVEAAFKSLDETLAEKKRFIQEEMMPVVLENAREMALENEINELENDAKADNEVVEDTTISQDDIPDVDDSLFDELDDDEDTTGTTVAEEEAERHYNYDSIDTAPVEEVVEVTEEVKKPVETAKASNVKTEEVEEDGSLDNLMEDLDKEEAALNVVDDEDETPEEIREKFKKTLEEVKITSDPVDFSKFKIRKNAVNSNVILQNLQTSRVVKKADWALYYSKKSVTFVECSGPELDNLRKSIANSNGVNSVITSLRFIYNHIEDANKPKFEAWTKLIRTEDIESLYYGLYKACYSNTNLIARQCESNTCRKTSLIDTNIDDMVVYGEETDDHEKVKAEFKEILSKDTTTEKTTFESTLLQISDDIVISYSPATLYSTFIQFATLKSEITDKYGEILNIMAYIDGFFAIDRKTQELVPIEIKEYPTNLNKTVLARLKVFTEILKSLSNDQYNILTAKLNTIIKNPKITYIFPKVTCPECGAEIPEAEVDSMLNLLFTRAQLAQIKSL